MLDKVLGTVVALAMLPAVVSAVAEDVRKIQDNSFLLEEAYNQEDGVVQHIQAFQLMEGGSWAYSFTQEWPMPTQKHQFSYSIPYLRLPDPESATGFGDILLNYRYQAVLKGTVAFSPRISLITPTGDQQEGLGSGAWGFQGNLPLSLELGERWATHWNLGGTFIPGAKGPDGAEAAVAGYNYGASLIFFVNDDFNLVLEAVGGATDTIGAGSGVDREHFVFLNPGLRYAIDFDWGLQIVPGLSFPVGVGPSGGEYGVFLYLSFEHPLFKPKGPLP